MLSASRPGSLERLRFPLAAPTKPEVRARRRRQPRGRGPPDSQDLCFLAGEGKRDFLRRHAGLAERQGEIVDTEGAVLGVQWPPRLHGRPAPGPRRRRAGAALRARDDAEANPVTSGRESCDPAGPPAARPAPRRRRVDTVRLRHHSPTLDCSVEPRDGGERDRARRARRRGPPARSPACWTATSSSATARLPSAGASSDA